MATCANTMGVKKTDPFLVSIASKGEERKTGVERNVHSE
jgi:hypothetical protein